MKKNLLLIAFLFTGILAFAQEVRLDISNLNGSELTTNLTLKKAKLTAGQSGIYSIERKIDSNSQNIAAASESRKSFSSAFLVSQHANGNRGVLKLVNVYFSDYSKKGRTEKFSVHFESSEEQY